MQHSAEWRGPPEKMSPARPLLCAAFPFRAKQEWPRNNPLLRVCALFGLYFASGDW
jgi:hypothetical protein